MNEVQNKQLLDGLSDGITVQDMDFNIIYQNQAMREAFGNHLGEKCYAIYEKRTKICEGCGVLKAIETRKANVVLRAGVMANGETAYWENACIPMSDANGKMIAGMEVCRNVTSRVTLEKEVKDRNLLLGRLNDQLEQRTLELQQVIAQREAMAKGLEQEMERRSQLEEELLRSQKMEAVGQLAAGVAHEINTPMQFIGDNTRFVQESLSSLRRILAAYAELFQAARSNTITPELLDRLETTVNAADLNYLMEQMPTATNETLEGVARVSEIVSAMKEFSHPGGKEKEATNLNRAIESTVIVARNAWKNVADIQLELDEHLPAVICHVGDFNQTMLNLITNATHAIGDAIKQTPGAKGLITLGTRRDGNFVEVRVGDTGTGIPEAIRSRLFELFFTTKDVGKGKGQGLPMVYAAIVKRHNGTVTFESETGKGTTFILRLPITPPGGTSAPGRT